MPAPRLPQVLLAAASILAAVPIVRHWLDPALGLSGYSVSILLGHLAAVAALGIALALAWKGWHAAGAPALALFLLAFGIYNGSFALLQAFRSLFPGVGGALYDVTLGAAVGGGLGALVHFSAVFPLPPEPARSAPPTGARRWLLLRRLRSLSASLAFAALTGTVVGALLAVDGLFLQPRSYVGARQWLIQLVMVAGFSVASLNLWVAYAHLGRADRVKVFWVGEGILILGLGVAVPLGFSLTLGTVGRELPLEVEWYALASSEIAFVACLAFAVFGRGAIDSSLLFRRTTIAGGFTILALFLFSGIEDLVTGFIVASLGLPAAVGTWIAGGLVALAFAPLYRWAERRKEPVDSSPVAPSP